MWKKFVFNPIVKVVVVTLLPMVASLLYSEGRVNDEMHVRLLAWAVIVFVMHLVILALYEKHEKNNKIELDSLRVQCERQPQEFSAIPNLLKKYKASVHNNANELYNLIRMQRKHSDISNWSWLSARGDEICEGLYTFVRAIAESGDKFSVNMMFRKVEHNGAGFTMMSRCTSDECHIPASYRGFVPESEAETTFYKKLFDRNISRPEILMTKEEIRRNFADVGNVNYNQYVALPISCYGRVVGLMQIVAYDDSCLTRDRGEMERLCNTYFALAQSIMLLSDKNENIQQICER